MKIPFNRPYFTGNEIQTIIKAAMAGQVSGNGLYTKKCHRIFEKKFGFTKTLLTTSCTDALEMAAVLCNLHPGDEVIAPSYTFVSTPNAFALHRAKIVFADSSEHHPNIDPEKIEELITDKTRAIVLVHYGGVACDMDRIMDIAGNYGLTVIEDAAHSIDSYFKGKALGSIGHFGTFSFHETKNLISGEGGMLAVNDTKYSDRAEIIWEKGTNRAAFHRGEVKKYEWVDVGSSYLPSEVMAAILHAQLMSIKSIQKKRKEIWESYHHKLLPLHEQGIIKLPLIPDYASNNGSMFYIMTRDLEERTKLLKYLARNNIHAVFHYLPLHTSPYYKNKHDGRELPNAVRFAETIVRLPFYYELGQREIDYVVDKVGRFYG
jgi:dTDP-4-amino-4,6-dideoxygalactose transaminase